MYNRLSVGDEPDMLRQMAATVHIDWEVDFSFSGGNKEPTSLEA